MSTDPLYFVTQIKPDVKHSILVVSPLVSLMADQKRHLEEKGVSCGIIQDQTKMTTEEEAGKG